MNIITIAWILLMLRACAVAVILYIIFRITVPNLKAENDPLVKPVRWVLFSFSILFLLGNVVPILVDYGTIATYWYDPTDTLDPVLTAYTLNNAISSLIYSIAFLTLFLVSEKVNLKLTRANNNLAKKNTTLKQILRDK